METIEGNNNIAKETLSGISSSSQPPGPPHITLNPTPEETYGGDLGSENGGGGGQAVVVTTRVVEKTEVTVVKVVQETKDDIFMLQEEGEAFEKSVKEKTENNNEVEENEKEGGLGHLLDVGGDEGMNVNYNNEGKENEKEGSLGHLFDVDGDEGMNVNYNNEAKEHEKEGVLGHLFDVDGDGDEGINVDYNNEAKEKEKEGGFDHLFDGEKGMDVNYNSEANEKEKEDRFDHLVDGDKGMDVDYNNEANEKEKEGVFDHLFDGDKGIDVNFAEEKVVSAGDPMDVCLPDQKEEKPENFAGVFEFTEEDMNENQNNEKNVENGEDNGTKLAENDESEEEEEHDYVVGDFVWGKIKSHPWWPGQIYDPSDASDYATTIKRKGHLLVAYFGDGSFSWCSPSQLKPFIDHFPEMSNQSDSKKFVHAVRTALEAVGNLVESELTSKSQTVDRVVNADVANSGIKPGVPVPKGNTVRVLIDQMTPIELLLKLETYATLEPCSRMIELELDLTVVKSWLGAFYLQKGSYLLQEYHEPKCIEGLEDKSRIGIVDSDVNGPSECGENGDDKLYQRRKQKSVAELLSVEDEPKVKKTKPVKDGSSSGRKRKATLVVEVSESPETDQESNGGGGGVDEDSMCSPRQRKKSKYLSPPYLSPVWTGKLSGSGSGSFKEPKPEYEKEKEKENVPEKAAKQLEETSSKRKPRQKRRIREGSDDQEGKIVIDGNVNVDKVLNGLLLAALDPWSCVEKKKLSVVTRFVSYFRSSIFESGSKIQPHSEEEAESEVGFVKRKIEKMREIVEGCEEDEMSGEVKGRLEEVIMEVLERVK